MRPRYSHSSRENATPSSGISLIASCKRPPPPGSMRICLISVSDGMNAKQRVKKGPMIMMLRDILRFLSVTHVPLFRIVSWVYSIEIMSFFAVI